MSACRLIQVMANANSRKLDCPGAVNRNRFDQCNLRPDEVAREAAIVTCLGRASVTS